MTPDAYIFIPVDQALALYPCPGLTADLVEYIARHHGILPYSEHPTQGFLVHEQDYRVLSQQLKSARQQATGYIRIKEATEELGYTLGTLYRLIDQGYIRKGQKRGELLHSDVAFFAQLATMVQLSMGKALLPPTYAPEYMRL